MIEKPKEFDRIWLQTCSDSMSEWYGESTWCHDKVNDDDVEYVSAKLYAEQAARIAELEADAETYAAKDQENFSLRQQRDEPCLWVRESDGTWETGCDNMFMLNEGGPRDNDMKYCCYCGRPLIEEES